MLYSNRFKQILKICLEQDPDYVSIDALAKRLKTSRRTIFRELQNVDLKRYRLSLASKAGKGIRLEGKEEDKRALLDDLEAESIPYFHKEERQKYLAFELLRFPEVKKLVYYGNLKGRCPHAKIYPVMNFMGANEYDQIVHDLCGA